MGVLVSSVFTTGNTTPEERSGGNTSLTTPAPNVLECGGSDKGKEITPPDGIVPLDSPHTSKSERTGVTQSKEQSYDVRKEGESVSVQRKRKGGKVDGKVNAFIDGWTDNVKCCGKEEWETILVLSVLTI